MSNMQKILLLTSLALLVFGGCDRYVDDKADANRAPQVRFINFPEDSTQFSYAPVIHWTGHDDDGFIVGFEYYDDASDEGIAAYRAGDAEWQAYLNSIPASAWTYTELANRQIYLMTEVGEITEHLFLVRSVDNMNARSAVAWRTFFRTNERPDKPTLRWALAANDPSYYEYYEIPDTLLVGDTLSATYTGVQILWKGTDPDSRIGNVIQLEFSYTLVRLPNDTVPLPVRDDSNRVVGYRAGWSNWTVNAQIALYGLESGNYAFFLRSRDDGFAISDTSEIRFTAEKPTFARRIMIVDENKQPTAPEALRGGLDADTLLGFYRGFNGEGGVVREGIALANILAPFAQPPGVPPIEPFDFDEIFWYSNRNGDPIPYALISQFDLVWIIDDDHTAARSDPAVVTYTKVLGDYLDVGGKLWYTGRRLFNKSMSISTGQGPISFLSRYFNLFTVRSKDIYSGTVNPTLVGLDDFQGAVASDPQYPDLFVDTLVTGRLRYGPRAVTYPPEIETFGRSAAQQSFDFSTTLYNYKSTTSDTSLYSNIVANYDCNVDTLSDSTVVVLIPRDETLPLLSASRIRNVTRGVDADFIRVRNLSDNPFLPRWRIFASIPSSAGAWTNSDVLEVTYRFIPLSSEHDEPVATNFVKYSGTFEVEITENGIRTRVQATPRYRSSLFTFPLAYMNNQTFEHPILGTVPSVSMLIANQFLYFNQNLDINFNFN